jgi:hypothetical protein
VATLVQVAERGRREDRAHGAVPGGAVVAAGVGRGVHDVVAHGLGRATGLRMLGTATSAGTFLDSFLLLKNFLVIIIKFNYIKFMDLDLTVQIFI